TQGLGGCGQLIAPVLARLTHMTSHGSLPTQRGVGSWRLARVSMMLSSRPLLVARDRSLGQSIQAAFPSPVGQPLLLPSYAAARCGLGRQRPRVVLCALDSPDDASAAVDFLQEVCLEDWPARVILVEGEAVADSGLLDRLQPGLAERVRWP